MHSDSPDAKKALEPVECYAGAEYPERPRSFEWKGKRLEIAQITAQWKSPLGNIFQVLTTEQEVFELFFNQETDSWTIEPL